jgi:Tol biopolymer transport system component
MALAAGTRLASFEIVDMVGAGGMGEVYRARDLRLERTVALKILPAHWADNSDMRQRFEREAQAVAAINHPNICTLHDVGRHQPPNALDAPIDFLVLEYLQGETLAQRLERGPLALDEALRIGIAIADALDKAHRRGVTHRDLKPGNVFLVRGGSSDPPIAKLLDFGLAKLKGESGGAGSGRISVSAVPTNPQLTAQGTILGTLQYMAPEQLEGLEADARTDIFAFGVLLHEMISGKKTFEGKSRVLLMSAIATAEPPPISSVQPAASPALDHVVNTCLAKDPADRWQTMRDVLAELQWVAAGGGAETLSGASRSRGARARLPLAMAAAGVLVVVASAAVIALYLQRPIEAAQSRVLIPIQLTADAAQIVNPANFDGAAFAISPDGRSVTFAARSNTSDPLLLYRRAVDAVTPQRLSGTDDATQPFWSADSHSIGFVAGGKLRKVEASGGPPQDIAPAADVVGADWNRDGVIIFGSSKGLFRVSAQGGTPELLTKLEAPESGHYWPHFLPDGRHFVYLAWSSQAGGRAIIAGALDDSKLRKRVMPAESKAMYAQPGYLVFRRENAVYSYAFDADTLEISGEPNRVADGVASSGANGDGTFSVAHAGPLAYYYGSVAAGTGAQNEAANWQLAWANRDGGRQDATPGPPGPYRGIEVSPDGTRIAVHKHERAGGDVFVIEPRGAVNQLTFNAAQHNSMPIWSQPNGERIVFSSFRNGKWGLYQTLSNGSGTAERLYEAETPMAPMSWSGDGKRLVFWVQDAKTAGDLWVLTLDDKKAEPFLTGTGTANESHAQISPDGKWIAYASNENDGRTEIYVKPFPKGAGTYRISNKGGDWPRWNRNNKELIFHELGNGAFVSNFLSSAVNGSGPAFEFVEPKAFLWGAVLNLPHSGGDYHTYDLSPKADQLLVPQLAQSIGGAATVAAQGAEPPFGLVVATNWQPRK